MRVQGNQTLVITLTGTHFAPQSVLFIDGQPAGIVSQTTPQQLVAVINNAMLPPGLHAIGVRNPDGTAAQVLLREENNNNNHSPQGTPGGGDDSGPDD